MKHTNLRAHIRHLCGLGLPSETLMPTLLPVIRELIPADSAGFFWVDAAGDMQNLIAERMLSPPKMRLFFDHFYAGGKYDFRENFNARANSVNNVAISESDASFRQSAYYNEILKDIDAHHVLYGIVRDQSVALGQLSLYRGKSSPAFTDHDQEALSSVMRYISHAVASPSTGISADTEFVDSLDDAVLLVNGSGKILQASEDGWRLAVQAAGGSILDKFHDGENSAVHAVLAEAVARLRDEPMGNVARATEWGRIQLRAYQVGRPPTQPDAVIAVRITRQEPMVLKFARSLQLVGLPPQQKEVALHIARGLSNHEISEQMGLSANTVAYHIKQLFSRLESHGRAELVERIIGR